MLAFSVFLVSAFALPFFSLACCCSLAPPSLVSLGFSFLVSSLLLLFLAFFLSSFASLSFACAGSKHSFSHTSITWQREGLR